MARPAHASSMTYVQRGLALADALPECLPAIRSICSCEMEPRPSIVCVASIRREGSSMPAASNVIFGRSSSHFTRVTRIFAEELDVPYSLEVVRDLLSTDANDYGG